MLAPGVNNFFGSLVYGVHRQLTGLSRSNQSLGLLIIQLSVSRKGRSAVGERRVVITLLLRFRRAFLQDMNVVKQHSIGHVVRYGIGCCLWFCGQRADGIRSSEKFMHGIKVLMAKNYIDNLSEEIKKGMLEKKAEQSIYPSCAPLGYQNVMGPNGKRIIEPHPTQAPIIKQMFEWYATGQCSIDEVVRRAHLAGLLSRRTGQAMSRSTYIDCFKAVFTPAILIGTAEPIAAVTSR